MKERILLLYILTFFLTIRHSFSQNNLGFDSDNSSYNLAVELMIKDQFNAAKHIFSQNKSERKKQNQLFKDLTGLSLYHPDRDQ